MASRLDGLLVGLALAVVLLLADLVTHGVLGRSGTGTEGCVGVLGDLLVALLGDGGTSALDGLGNRVGGVLDGVHDGWFVGGLFVGRLWFV
eukprot:TRINITY_DN5773_c0_g1_i1.p2 TRINITY_DN5773_c0_g1~~TRINITY_DN5773_c0_g1_i1.p2  ORF type:complete len:100 (-),score=18.22 TRINITY_DN5773_c0_g1_i1:12-284(-)